METLHSMTAGDLLAEFDRVAKEAALLVSRQPFEWDALKDSGYELCKLSQQIHLTISETRRRIDMPCNVAVDRLATTATMIADSIADAEVISDRDSYEALQQYLANIRERSNLLKELGERRQLLDEEFGINAIERPIASE